ncbi:isochorismate hydrolase [Neokomagataea thailandica NBRC 106555]|uniref:Cysteine hydrolase n=2 Tax=Neokomagataea TaxID=1223423 RepID=A0A4Y6VAU8_9PROT|nr:MULTISPECIES: cysteine hydrolase [Neokomagataea]QDH26058.1 cysteine hydrolase [Neokomagataea tanensis]GBR55176.1 isochorismate hydrolase [Neokomagataea thailandica NBRC 106555]
MNTAFIGLDYIIDIADVSGKIPSAANEVIRRQVIEKANHALKIAHDKNWLKILVKVGFSPSYVEQPKNSQLFGLAHKYNAINLRERGTDFHPNLEVNLSDIIIEKPRVSGFYCTKLEAILRANKIDRLIIAGVSSTWAVQSTVRDAHDRDYEVFVCEPACAASTEDEHYVDMKILQEISKIINLDDMAGM